MEFHRAVVCAYHRLAEAEPRRFVRLDARLPPGDIHKAVLAALGELLAARP